MTTDLATPTMDLGGIPLNQLDDLGIQWYVKSLVGWTSPAVRPAIADRSGDQGSYQGQFLHGPRAITILGTFIAPDEDSMRDARERLAGVTNTLADIPFTVNERFPKYATVRRAGELRMSPIGKLAVEFQIALIAADPRKYSLDLNQFQLSLIDPTNNPGIVFSHTFPVAVWGTAPRSWHLFAMNNGNYPTYPLLVFTGPVLNPRIINLTTGDLTQLNLDIPGGSWVSVDPAARLVLLAGQQSRRSALSRQSSWWALQPDINEIAFTADTYTSDSRLTVAWRSAWL